VAGVRVHWQGGGEGSILVTQGSLTMGASAGRGVRGDGGEVNVLLVIGYTEEGVAGALIALGCIERLCEGGAGWCDLFGDDILTQTPI
jgi:hypothetical protein